jgi:hypothetical protein
MRCILVILALTVSAVFGQNNRSAVSLSGNDMATCTVPDPCRTFDVAISKTNSGGEVVVLSTAGYGPFTVTKSVSIISPPAYHAAMAPTSGTAITVNAPGATVVLRNLYLNSLGALTGVSIQSASIVHVEGLVVNYFGLNAVEITGMIGGSAELFVKDAEIRDNGQSGILLSPSSGNVVASIDHARLERNLYGLIADSGVDLTVRETVAARNLSVNFYFQNAGSLSPLRAAVERSIAAHGGNGFVASAGARLTIRNSAAVLNGGGFLSVGSLTEMVLDRCLAAHNSDAIETLGFANASIMVSNSTVVYNGYGIAAGFDTTIRAFGNTVTRNNNGIYVAGTFRSGGHNFVDGNETDTTGTITSVPTM